jgi:hypothetical protein
MRRCVTCRATSAKLYARRSAVDTTGAAVAGVAAAGVLHGALGTAIDGAAREFTLQQAGDAIRAAIRAGRVSRQWIDGFPKHLWQMWRSER